MGQLVRGAPGLYLKGLPSEPILPLSAITGFVGIAERGPLHRPEPIRTWDEYLTVFGDPVDHAFLPSAVYGFFRNGGRRCFVVRVADLTDASGLNLPNRCPRVDVLSAAAAPIQDANGQETIRIQAINEGRWGNRIQFQVQDASQSHMPLTALTAAAPAGSVTISVDEPFDLVPPIGPDPGLRMRLAPPADPFGGRVADVQAVNTATGVVTLQAALDVDMPVGTLVLGQGFKLIFTFDDRTEVFDNLSMSPANLRYFANVINGDESLAYIERIARGHSILVKAAHVIVPAPAFRPGSTTVKSALIGGGDGFRYSAGTFLDASSASSIPLLARAESPEILGRKGDFVRVRADAFATRTALAATAGVSEVVLENAADLIPGDALTLTDPGTAVTETHPVAAVGGDNKVTLTVAGGLTNSYPLGATATVQGRFTLSVFRRTENREPAEVHRNLSADPTDLRYFRTRLGAASQLLCGDGPDVPLAPPVGELTLSGGRDPGTIDLRWYTGYEPDGQYFAPTGLLPGAPSVNRYGLAALESVDEIDLVAVPDLAGQTLLPIGAATTPEDIHLLAERHLLYHAARLGDRMALLDPRAHTTIDDAVRLTQQLAHPLTTKFAALYYPWLKVVMGGATRDVPPSGFVAGIMARVDGVGGVGHAPANAPVKDAVDVEALLDQVDQDRLNPAGVNVVRKFEAPALELWGARTLSADPAARYVNVRRLLITIKKAIGRTLLWTVFEPNGPTLRRRIQSNLVSLMQTLVAGGATPAGEDAFFVRCDDSNNPVELASAGQVIATVGVALLAPAEFIVLNVKRTPDAVSVAEEAV